jgi:hypothetical protein
MSVRTWIVAAAVFAGMSLGSDRASAQVVTYSPGVVTTSYYVPVTSYVPATSYYSAPVVSGYYSSPYSYYGAYSYPYPLYHGYSYSYPAYYEGAPYYGSTVFVGPRRWWWRY